MGPRLLQLTHEYCPEISKT